VVLAVASFVQQVCENLRRRKVMSRCNATFRKDFRPRREQRVRQLAVT
jgi:hypothetical protein